MANPGTSTYPAALDNFDNPGTATFQNQSGYSHSALHSQVHEAIEKIENVLGTTSGTANVFAKKNNETFGTISVVGGTIALNTINADGNSDITMTAGTSKIVRTQAIRQDIGTTTYTGNVATLYGWGFTTGTNGAISAPGTVTFGRNFTTVPIVLVNAIGFKDNSDPTSPTDFTQNAGYLPDIRIAGTSTFIVETFNVSSGGTIASVRRCGFTWMAIGQV